MQNKYISLIALMAVFGAVQVQAQELDLLATDEQVATASQEVVSTPAMDELADFSADLSQKKAVDFPPRSSLDSLELAPLPGIYETNITGPQPMAESVSVNDTPSEQLLGRLTPEVFQEMAELERDNAYLKLQIQKETMKNDLENLRSNYRQARLDEIAKREEVVRSRIQWWQEQEKLRQEVEKERAEAEEVKNKMAEAEALKAQLEAGMNQDQTEEDEILEEVSTDATYTLINIKGTRGNLVAKVKNTVTEEVSIVKVGDSLNGEVITNITPDSVVIDRAGTEYVVQFPTV